MFFLLILLIFAVIAIAMVGPIVDQCYDGFNSSHGAYVDPQGQETIDHLYGFYGYLFVIVLFGGFIFVIVDSIRKQQYGDMD